VANHNYLIKSEETMLFRLLYGIIVSAAVAVSSAQATPITYTFTGTGSGTVDGTASVASFRFYLMLILLR
jgi:hypothetical protein